MADKRFIAPQLADLRQDIAGVIPLNVIQEWMQSPKDFATQTKILSTFRKPGYVVSSDSCGLTKMGSQRPFLDVMKMIHDPKEMLHSYGTAIGGRAVGLWAADNTEMFYEQSIDPREIMQQMIAVQRELAPRPLQIGMAVHAGEFVLIGHGAFGPDADLVEALAEDQSGPGEILVTPEFRFLLESRAFPIGFAPKGETGAFACDYSASPAQAAPRSSAKYPFPFTEDFYTFLENYSGCDSEEAHAIFQRYGREAVVVLVKVRHPGRSLLLDTLTQSVLVNAILAEVLAEHRVMEVKSNGSLGIFLADTAQMALDFTLDLRTALLGNGYDFNIGVASGDVLVFPMKDADEQNEIAGQPVNLASKICEDVDERCAIYFEKSVAAQLKQVPDATPFRLNVSHVEITGVKVCGA